MRGLYAIVDLDALGRNALDPLDFTKAVLAGGATTVQLRAKHASARTVLALSTKMIEACRVVGAAFVQNDRPDIALLVGADFVHVGQGDLDPREVKALASRMGTTMGVGMSTHDDDELRVGLEGPLDYIAIGPVFGTKSKQNPEPTVGRERARELARFARGMRPTLPRVAIGGITTELAPSLSGAFDAIAVIGALVPERYVGDAEGLARAIVVAWERAS